MKKTEFRIKIDTRAMYCFLLYHVYHSVTGIISIIIGLGAAGYGICVWNHTDKSWAYLLLGLIFLLYEPIALFVQASGQIKKNPVFRETLKYEISDAGIRIVQKKMHNELPWEKIYKLCESRTCILIYTDAHNAIIWDKKQLGQSVVLIKKLLKEYVPADKCKLKG